MATRADEYIRRLESGEENSFLVYELCKLWEPQSFDDLAEKLPTVVSFEAMVEGFEEYEISRRRG